MFILNGDVLFGMLIGIGISLILSGIGAIIFSCVVDDFKEDRR